MVSLAKGVQIGGLEMNTNRLLGYSRLDLQGWTSEKNVEFRSAFFVKCANSWRINDLKFFGRAAAESYSSSKSRRAVAFRRWTFGRNHIREAFAVIREHTPVSDLEA